MNKRISLGAAVAMILIVAAVVFSITMHYATNSFNTRVADLKSREQQYDKYTEIDRQVRLYSYYPIQDNPLMDSVAKGYVSGIGDKYATYYSAEEYKKLTQSDESDNVGIGAVVDVSSDDFYLEVLEVYPDSPAQVAGIEPGDLIVKIDEQDLTRDNSREMLASIEGPQGTQITLVTRRGSVESQPLIMTRRAVQLPIVTSYIMEGTTVGYMRIEEFSESTYNQFNRELQKLTSAGAASLIFDIRDNKDLALNRDNLSRISRILDKLLPEGVLLTAINKDGSTEALATSDANEITLPMVALVNGGTRGAGELFAQSIRDFEKGRVVGSTTAGKGVLQEMVRLSDGSAVELTTAVYQTKSGVSFNDTGVKPDFEVTLDTNWTTLDENTDVQLVKAKEVAIAMELTIANANMDSTEPDAAAVSAPATNEVESSTEESTVEESGNEGEAESESESESQSEEDDESESESEADADADTSEEDSAASE